MSAMIRIDRCFLFLQKEREGINFSFSLFCSPSTIEGNRNRNSWWNLHIIVETYVSSGSEAKFHMILDRLTNVTGQTLMVY